MAQFRATIENGKNLPLSRLGHKSNGISSHTCGWDTGIRVEAYYDNDLGDIFLVYQTSGSGFKGKSVLLGKLVGDSFQAQENT